MPTTQRLGVKNAWISDLHLGAPQTHAVWMLNDFLSLVAPQQLTLLGDTIDGYEMQRKSYWTKPCEEALQRLFSLPDNGTQVLKIAGNHDIGLRGFMAGRGVANGDRENFLLLESNGKATLNGQGSGIRLMQSATFKNAEGTHLYVHGDEQQHSDPAQSRLVQAYDAIYYPLARATPVFNKLRSLAGPKPYVVLTQKFQDMVCKAMDFVGDFERAQAAMAKAAGMQGVICGHIHYQADKVIDGIHYRNPGSMQVDQKLLIENERGEIHQVNWGSVCMQLRAARKAGHGVSRPLDALAEQIGAQRLSNTARFSFRDPGQSADGQSRSFYAPLLAQAIYGTKPGSPPVQSAPV